MTSPEATTQNSIGINKLKEQARSSENLAFLYQGLLTGIVRLQAGREHMPPPEVFRKRTIKALKEVEHDARAAGYDLDDVKDSHFAVVAFLDSVVLNSAEAGRAEWERRTLQEELFGVTNAGEVFFDRLDSFRGRRDSRHLADLLEVYGLCLLLGFEGRYSGGLRGELVSVTDNVRRRIDNIRGKAERISPTGLPHPDTQPQALPSRSHLGRYRWITLAAILLTIVCYVVLKLHLAFEADRAYSKLF